jgi:hypothetical protein
LTSLSFADISSSLDSSLPKSSVVWPGLEGKAKSGKTKAGHKTAAKNKERTNRTPPVFFTHINSSLRQKAPASGCYPDAGGHHPRLPPEGRARGISSAV